jgi:hypothetical protein
MPSALGLLFFDCIETLRPVNHGPLSFSPQIGIPFLLFLMKPLEGLIILFFQMTASIVLLVCQKNIHETSNVDWGCAGLELAPFSF